MARNRTERNLIVGLDIGTSKVAAIVGDIDEAMDSSLYADLRVSSLTAKFGAEESMTHVLRCIEEAAREMLQNS